MNYCRINNSGRTADEREIFDGCTVLLPAADNKGKILINYRKTIRRLDLNQAASRSNHRKRLNLEDAFSSVSSVSSGPRCPTTCLTHSIQNTSVLEECYRVQTERKAVSKSSLGSVKHKELFHRENPYVNLPRVGHRVTCIQFQD